MICSPPCPKNNTKLGIERTSRCPGKLSKERNSWLNKKQKSQGEVISIVSSHGIKEPFDIAKLSHVERQASLMLQG